MAINDGRQDVRYSISEDVIINNSVYARSVDISLGGMFVTTDDTTIKQGANVKVFIPAIDFGADAEVRFYKQGTGAGLKFVVNTKQQWDSLVSVIDHLKETVLEVKHSLLIVEENKELRNVMKDTLQAQGYSVAEANDGMQAIRLMNFYPFDAVLVDLNIKRIDGVELISMIRHAPDHKTKPIIALSDKDDMAVSRRLRTLGTNRFIIKSPSLPQEALDALEEILANKRKPS